jgi:hypothetical protein
MTNGKALPSRLREGSGVGLQRSWPGMARAATNRPQARTRARSEAEESLRAREAKLNRRRRDIGPPEPEAEENQCLKQFSRCHAKELRMRAHRELLRL